jgi:hypothetical protein
MSEYVSSGHAPRQPLTSQANGYAKPVRSPTWASQDQYPEYDQSRLVPDRVNELHKKPSGEMHAISSDQDSVMDYYKSHANNKKGPTAVKGRTKKKPTKAQMADPNWSALEHDENNWIHRDKLKEIETRELEEAGFRVGRSSGSNSRSQSATRRARSRTNSESLERTQNGEDRHEPRRLVSPIPAEDEEYSEEFHAWSPSSPGEVPPELQPSSPRTGHSAGRPSTSRIPLPKTSGIPVPSSLAERDAPLPRSRTGSASWNDNAIAANGARVRSGSVGSQVLLDDNEDGQQHARGHRRNASGTSGSGSPPKSPQKSSMKARTPGKPNPTSGARKTSVKKTQPKNRVASATSPRRPGTSGGSASRPTTAHRPEGEAPWIATMYKPDPRLPPDQQIIPTHAKRMQQEQWENEGRVGSMYDRDFRLLNDAEMAGKRLSQVNPIDLERARENEQWPLPSPIKHEQQEAPHEKVDTNAAKSAAIEQGGYRLTPTIPQGARSPSPKLAPPIVPADAKPTTTRVPEPKEEAEAKKGCCCIVM